MKRTLLCIFVLAIAAWAPAPLVGRPSDRSLLQPEATAADRERQQALGRSQQEVGGVVQNENQQTQTQQLSDPDAAKTVGSARTTEPSNDPLAAAAVADASETLQNRNRSSASFWLWGIVLLAAGFGFIMLLRNWANKTIPDMPEAKSVRW